MDRRHKTTFAALALALSAATGCATSAWKTHAVAVDVEGWRYEGDPTVPEPRSGNGTVLGRYLVTDAALVRRSTQARAANPANARGEATRILALDLDRDIAVLHAPASVAASMPKLLKSENLAEGQALVVGTPDPGAQQGRTVYLRRFVQHVRPGRFIVDGNLDPAAIGSPVFDGVGRLAGILKAVVVVGGQSQGIVLPAWEIAPVLAVAEKAGEGTLLKEFYGGRELARRCPVRQERFVCVGPKASRDLLLELNHGRDYEVRASVDTGTLHLSLGGVERDLPGADPMAGAFLFTAPRSSVVKGVVTNPTDGERCLTLGLCRVEW